MLINFGPFPFLCIMGFPCQPEMAFFSFFFRVRIPIRIWMEKEHHDSVQMEQEMEKAKSTL